MMEKARVYLANGTGEVWVFWPESSQVDMWRAEDKGDADTYTVGPETVDGETNFTDLPPERRKEFIESSVVAGFTLALDDVFPPRLTI